MLPQLVGLGGESQTLQLLSIPKTNTQPSTRLKKPGFAGRHDVRDAEREECRDRTRGRSETKIRLAHTRTRVGLGWRVNREIN